jgi:predicted secreted Zn-dependent protease
MITDQATSKDLNWRVSRTCDGGHCVIVACRGDWVLFGNSAEPDGPVYAYSKAEWNEFIAGVKRGDFDDIG